MHVYHESIYPGVPYELNNNSPGFVDGIDSDIFSNSFEGGCR